MGRSLKATPYPGQLTGLPVSANIAELKKLDDALLDSVARLKMAPLPPSARDAAVRGADPAMVVNLTRRRHSPDGVSLPATQRSVLGQMVRPF